MNDESLKDKFVYTLYTVLLLFGLITWNLVTFGIARYFYPNVKVDFTENCIANGRLKIGAGRSVSRKTGKPVPEIEMTREFETMPKTISTSISCPDEIFFLSDSDQESKKVWPSSTDSDQEIKRATEPKFEVPEQLADLPKFEVPE